MVLFLGVRIEILDIIKGNSFSSFQQDFHIIGETICQQCQKVKHANVLFNIFFNIFQRISSRDG